MNLSYAIATPSYAGDVERCRLLCASIDRFVSGHGMHYLLVEDGDVALFRPLEGPRRQVIAESDLLPAWLRPRPDPLSLGRRRVWTGARALMKGVPPLRGWHAQQLRKLALPLKSDEDVILFADSDMLFLRPFALDSLASAEGVRLYSKPGGITGAMEGHGAWCENAATLLALPAPTLPSPDYINMVSWRRDVVRALIAHIEQTSGRDWLEAIARQRRFSEYVIYGYFVERVLGLATAGHWADERELCKYYWFGRDAGDIEALRSFEEVMEPWQVAVAVQSFIGAPIEQIRTLFERQ